MGCHVSEMLCSGQSHECRILSPASLTGDLACDPGASVPHSDRFPLSGGGLGVQVKAWTSTWVPG